MKSRRGLFPVVILFLTSVAACDFGPSGPGSLVGRATALSLGAVVLEVDGVGITSFEGRGNTQAYSAPLGVRENAHRVVLIDPQGGEIVFEIVVDDLDMEDPIIKVISAAGTDNLLLSVGSIEVTLER